MVERLTNSDGLKSPRLWRNCENTNRTNLYIFVYIVFGTFFCLFLNKAQSEWWAGSFFLLPARLGC